MGKKNILFNIFLPQHYRGSNLSERTHVKRIMALSDVSDSTLLLCLSHFRSSSLEIPRIISHAAKTPSTFSQKKKPYHILCLATSCHLASNCTILKTVVREPKMSINTTGAKRTYSSSVLGSPCAHIPHIVSPLLSSGRYRVRSRRICMVSRVLWCLWWCWWC